MRTVEPGVSLIGRVQVDPARVWAGFQERFFLLLALAVSATLFYIWAAVLPRYGVSLNGSPIVAGWTALNNAILYVHILTAIPPLVLGLIAFSTAARRASPRLYRWLGTVYCVGIWISAVTGFLLATANEHGVVARAGFGMLGIVWFVTTFYAYRTARAKDFVAHRVWMIRSYAITLAVVTVRPMFLFGPPAGLEAEAWYQLATWLCWVPNLAVAEIYARSTDFSGRLKTLKRRKSATPRATASR